MGRGGMLKGRVGNRAPALEVWSGFIGMEAGAGHGREARGLYKRCYAKRFAGNGTQVRRWAKAWG